MRKAKTNFWIKVSDDINLAFTKNDHRGFYNLVKQTYSPSAKALHAGYVGASGAVFKPGTDELTTTPEEARQVWHSHFTSVLAVPVVLTPFKPMKFDGKHTREENRLLSVEQLIPQIREFKLLRFLDGDFTLDQVHKAIDKIREDATPGKKNRPA